MVEQSGEAACAYRGCGQPAIVLIHFGNEYGSPSCRERPTAVAYCDSHAACVRRLFVVDAEKPIAVSVSA